MASFASGVATVTLPTSKIEELMGPRLGNPDQQDDRGRLPIVWDSTSKFYLYYKATSATYPDTSDGRPWGVKEITGFNIGDDVTVRLLALEPADTITIAYQGSGSKEKISLGTFGSRAAFASSAYTEDAYYDPLDAPSELTAPGATACPAGTVEVTRSECATAAELGRPYWAWPVEGIHTSIAVDHHTSPEVSGGCSVQTDRLFHTAAMVSNDLTNQESAS
jgi:hypothetical protein